MSPVADAQPITGGNAPATPPMTMFCGVIRFQPQGVYDDVEEDCEGEQASGCDIGRRVKDEDRAAAEKKSERKCFSA